MSLLSSERLQQKGSPTVLVPDRLQEKEGLLRFNLDSLGRLFQDDFKLPTDNFLIRLYDGRALGYSSKPFDVWRNGFRTPYRNTLNIPVWSSGNTDNTLMKRVIAHGLHLSESKKLKLPIRFLGTELLAASAFSIAIDKPDTPAVGVLILGIAGIIKADNTDIPNSNFLEVNRLRGAHDRDLYFANQAHLNYLTQTNLPVATIAK